MGCCCSKQEAQGQDIKDNAARWDPPPPPPPPEEEETVKEVLSETPNTKPNAKPTHANANVRAPSSPLLTHSDERSEQPHPSDDAPSLSEVSNATSATSSPTTTRERENEKDDITSTMPTPTSTRRERERERDKSYSGELVRAGAGGGGSRTERSSPAVVTGLGCRSGRTSPGPPLRNWSFGGNGNGSGVKRDAGERSGRRSLSPGASATRRELARPGTNVSRGVPVRRVPPPPNKAAAPLMSMSMSMSDRGDNNGKEREGLGGGKQESLENPSVSLECFIFL